MILVNTNNVLHSSVISFARYDQYTICLILLNKLSDVLPACTCASTISNIWSFCLKLNIFIVSPMVSNGDNLENSSSKSKSPYTISSFIQYIAALKFM